MDQATQQTSSTASPETRAPDEEQRATYHRARQLSSDVLDRVTQWPFAVEIEEDFPSGWRVHLKFRSSRVRGLLEFADIADVPVTRATTQFGVHIEALARVQEIELRASALLSHTEAASFEAQLVEPQQDTAPEQAPTEQEDSPPVSVMPAPTVVPLGSSVTAYAPAVARTSDGEQ